jgi:hypothetical protein
MGPHASSLQRIHEVNGMSGIAETVLSTLFGSYSQDTQFNASLGHLAGFNGTKTTQRLLYDPYSRFMSSVQREQHHRSFATCTGPWTSQVDDSDGGSIYAYEGYPEGMAK